MFRAPLPLSAFSLSWQAECLPRAYRPALDRLVESLLLRQNEQFRPMEDALVRHLRARLARLGRDN